MNKKQERLSNRAARYRGDCHFPRVVPETGLLRILGRFGRSVASERAAAVETDERKPEPAVAGK